MNTKEQSAKARHTAGRPDLSMGPLSHWKMGDRVQGRYFGISFTGELNAYTRPTHDYKNVIFCVTLDDQISLFGRDRTTIEVWTNHMGADDSIEAVK